MSGSGRRFWRAATACATGAHGGSGWRARRTSCAACRVGEGGVRGVDAPPAANPGVPGAPPRSADPMSPTASGPWHTASATQSPAPRCARVMSCCDMSACTCTPMPVATGIFGSSVTRVASSHGACAPSPLQPGTGSRSGASASFGSSARSSPPPGVLVGARGRVRAGSALAPEPEGARTRPLAGLFFLFGIDDRRAGGAVGRTGRRSFPPVFLPAHTTRVLGLATEN